MSGEADLPPLPWSVEESPWGHVYLKDADGKRFASLLGTYSRKFDTACFIAERFNVIAKRETSQ